MILSLFFKVIAAAVIIKSAYHALVDIVKRLARTDCNAGYGVFRNIAGNLCMLGHKLIHAVEQCAAAGQTDAVFCDVACKLGRSLFKEGADGFDDLLGGFLECVDHLI